MTNHCHCCIIKQKQTNIERVFIMGHHEHSHEYMHEHNIPHDHHHDYDHAHEACAEHNHCHGNCDGCNMDPKAEMIAMMKYMVNHNTAHASELAQLAGKLKEMGDDMAYEQVMQAVSDFEKGNMRLSTVLAAMNI